MKTRYWIYAGLVFLAFSTGTAPVQAAGSAADEVRAADDAWLKVYSAKDLDKSVAFFDERGSMLAPNAPIATGKPAVAKAIALDFAAGSVVWHADKAGVARSGDLGYTCGTYKSAFKDSSGKSSVDNGKYLTMWKKQKDGAWRCCSTCSILICPRPSRLRKNEEFSARSDIVELEEVARRRWRLMRGADQQQSGMFSYISAEQRVPKDHPLRAIRVMVDAALRESSWRFDAVYASNGRPSIAPEKLLRALLLQVLYTVRSERLLMEELDYNFLFRWFVGLNIDDPVWDVTVFTKNRERLLVADVARGFFNALLDQARARGLLSDEHFTVDGTLIEAWAGHKSFKRKGDDRRTPSDDPGNPSVDFHGERRTNATHQSTTDPQARLARKGPGKEAKLCYAGHVQMDNRYGLAVDTRLTQASGSAEPAAALAMAAEIAGRGRVTLGADKGYDQKELVRELRAYRVTPHVARKVHSAIDRRTTRHAGYATSQIKRKRVEEIFGWIKTIGGLRKTRHRGAERVGWAFTFAASAYNLVRMRNLSPIAT